jgi:predicted transcriptional regulator
MLEVIAVRLGGDKVRSQFEAAAEPIADPTSFSARLAAVTSERRLSLLLCLARRPGRVRDLAQVCGFDAAIAAEDLELLARHGLAARSSDGTWRACCSALSASVELLVDLVLTPRPPKEGTT